MSRSVENDGDLKDWAEEALHQLEVGVLLAVCWKRLDDQKLTDEASELKRMVLDPLLRCGDMETAESPEGLIWKKMSSDMLEKVAEKFDGIRERIFNHLGPGRQKTSFSDAVLKKDLSAGMLSVAARSPLERCQNWLRQGESLLALKRFARRFSLSGDEAVAIVRESLAELERNDQRQIRHSMPNPLNYSFSSRGRLRSVHAVGNALANIIGSERWANVVATDKWLDLAQHRLKNLPSWPPAAIADLVESIADCPGDLLASAEKRLQGQEIGQTSAKKPGVDLSTPRALLAAVLLQSLENLRGRPLDALGLDAFRRFIKNLCSNSSTRLTVIDESFEGADCRKHFASCDVDSPILILHGLKWNETTIAKSIWSVPASGAVRGLSEVAALARRTLDEESASDLDALVKSVAGSGKDSLRDWWEREPLSDDRMLQDALLVHRAALSVASAASRLRRPEPLRRFAAVLQYESPFSFGLARPSDGVLFHGGWLRFSDHVRAAELLEVCGPDGEQVVVLKADGLDDVAPLSALLIPVARKDDALARMFPEMAAAILSLRRRDPEYVGWSEFDSALRSAGSGLSGSASRRAFWALHPRARPDLYGEKGLFVDEYCDLLRALAKEAGAAAWSPSVDLESLDVEPRQTSAVDFGWRVEWVESSDERPSIAVRSNNGAIERTLRVPLPVNIRGVDRLLVLAPPLPGATGPLVEFERLREKLPSAPDQVRQKLKQIFSEWVADSHGGRWLNQFLKAAGTKDWSEVHRTWHEILTSEKGWTPVWPRVDSNGVPYWPRDQSAPDWMRFAVGGEFGSLSEIKFAIRPEDAMATIQVGSVVGTPLETAMRLQSLAKAAKQGGAGESLAHLAGVLLRQELARHWELGGPPTKVDLTTENLKGWLIALVAAETSCLERPFDEPAARAVAAIHDCLAGITASAGVTINPNSWPYRNRMGREEFVAMAEGMEPPPGRFSCEEIRGQVLLVEIGVTGSARPHPRGVLACGPAPAAWAALRRALEADGPQFAPSVDLLDTWPDAHAEGGAVLRWRAIEVFRMIWDCKPSDSTAVALEGLLNDESISLRSFRPAPGPLERSIEWYETMPAADLFRTSQVEKMIRPGLEYRDGGCAMKAVVQLKSRG